MKMEDGTLFGIMSAGGPHLLLDERLLLHWTGTDTPGSVPGIPTDYERACEVEEYIGSIPVGSGTGIVLSGDLLPAAWWTEAPGSNLIIRGLDTIHKNVLEQILHAAKESTWNRTGSISFVSGNVLLFDAALSGDEIRDEYVLSDRSGRGVTVGTFLDREAPDHHLWSDAYHPFHYASWGKDRTVDAIIASVPRGEYIVETSIRQRRHSTPLVLHHLLLQS
jgi:hypothetical protein